MRRQSDIGLYGWKRVVYLVLQGLFLPVFAGGLQAQQAIQSDISYSAQDSIVMEGTKTAILYGDAQVKYENMELKAAYIRLSLDSSLVYACGREDSAGVLQGTPVFTENGNSYEARAMQYNFKTKKGFTWGTVTQQGEGYVTSTKTKKVSEDEFCLQNGKYTTCDNHEHPHFYLALTKAKMKQGRYIVAGPSYMVVEDVPIPVGLPFGYFPITEKYHSGIIFPTIGEEQSRGFYARGFGYYFAINDYVDLSLTADIYSKGSWGLNMHSNYRWRYKFNGNVNLSFIRNVYGTPNTPDYNTSSDFQILWSHKQDEKMSPNTTLSASVNFSTSSYERNNVSSYYDINSLSQNTKESTVTLTQAFPNSPFTLSASLYVTQRTKDSTINLNLPSLNLSMSRVYPFKRKKAVGKERWYEKIAITYNMNLGNSVQAKENQFAHMNFLRDWKNGVKHDLPISASFTLFKYLNITANLNNNLKWYFRRVNKHWEGDAAGHAVADTTYGFYNIYQGSASLSLNTQLYGFYRLRSRSGKNAPVFRHKLTPSVAFTYAPDYGTNFWGYWDSYQQPTASGEYVTQYYDRYANGIYGGSPARGATGSVSFEIANNLEMKYWSKNDTVDKPKKVTLIDNFSFGSAYNFIADSLNWSDIKLNLRLKFWDKFSMNIDFILDPYTYQIDQAGNVKQVNVTQLQKNHVLGRLKSTGTSFGYTFSNETFKRRRMAAADAPPSNPQEDISTLEQNIEGTDPMNKYPSYREERKARWKEDDADYQKFSMPWSLTLNYSIRYAYDKFNPTTMEYDCKLTHNLSIMGSISFTKTWRASISTYYDITNNQWSYLNCTITKDLHCWQMSVSFVPIGLYSTYNFSIGVKSSLLQDLKYTKERDVSDNIKWF